MSAARTLPADLAGLIEVARERRANAATWVHAAESNRHDRQIASAARRAEDAALLAERLAIECLRALIREGRP